VRAFLGAAIDTEFGIKALAHDRPPAWLIQAAPSSLRAQGDGAAGGGMQITLDWRITFPAAPF
jgi:hypothetical protein